MKTDRTVSIGQRLALVGVLVTVGFGAYEIGYSSGNGTFLSRTHRLSNGADETGAGMVLRRYP